MAIVTSAGTSGSLKELHQDLLSVGMEVGGIDKEELLPKYNTHAKEIMIRQVITVDPSFTREEAAKGMVDHDINMLPVCQDDQVVVILTRGDIVKALAAECM